MKTTKFRPRKEAKQKGKRLGDEKGKGKPPTLQWIRKRKQGKREKRRGPSIYEEFGRENGKEERSRSLLGLGLGLAGSGSALTETISSN